jgi:hypothetical protein
MDRHANRSLSVGARRAFGLAALLGALASGCVSSGQLTPDVGVSTTRVSQVVSLWNNQVVAGVDPAHDGAPMYGLAGRVFLFGTEMREFVIADGNLVVELWATLPEQPQGPPVRLESWVIKKDLLNSACLAKDGCGQGYTMNLPWPSYRPDLKQVRLRMRYEPAKGLPVYGEYTVALNNGPGPEITGYHRMEGPNHQPVAGATPPGPAPQAGAAPAAPPAPPPVAGTGPQVGMVPPQGGGVQQALYQPPSPPAGAPQAATVPPASLMPWQQPGGVQQVPMPPAFSAPPAQSIPGVPQR